MLAVVFLLLVTGIGSANADRYAVLVLADDRLESSVDEQGISLKETIENYVSFLEAGKNEVEVYGSVRSNNRTALIYPTDSGMFDWEASEGGKNDRYFSRTIAQLGAERYDTVVVITGQMLNQQSRNADKTIYPADHDTKVILYGTVPISDNRSLIDVFQNSSGRQMSDSGVEDTNGFRIYGNTYAKLNESFDAGTTLNDLIRESCDGAVAPGADSLTIPAVLADHAVMMIKGTDLSRLNIIVNGQDMYHISTDRSETGKSIWYSQKNRFGADEIYYVAIPENISGTTKISGAIAETNLFYYKNPQYDSLVQKTAMTQNGLQYESDGTVLIQESDEKVIRELALIYPDLSFQALVTPFDASEPFVLHASDDGTIVWRNVGNVEADILVSLRPSRDSQKVLRSEQFHYQPIYSLLEEMKPDISMSNEGTALAKGTTLEYIIHFPLSDNRDTETDRRISDFINSALFAVYDENGNRINTASRLNDQGQVVVSVPTAPETEGTYQWKIRISSAPSYAVVWEKEFALPEFTIENHNPVSHPDLVDTSISKIVQPGDSVSVDLPQGLFTDEDGDKLTIHYSVLSNGIEIQSGTWIGENGESAAFTISGIDAFGDWTIETYAEDNDGTTSAVIKMTVSVVNGNTAPHVEESVRPQDATTVPLLRLSDYSLRIPEGLFMDDEENTLTIKGTLTNKDNVQTPFSYSGTNGRSESWEQHLNQFGIWKVEVYAQDEHGLQSDTVSFTVELVDALESLNGTLYTNPESPGKGDRIRLELALAWPEVYELLPVREWLLNCDVVVKEAYGSEYPMTLAEDKLVFRTDEIQMPETETTLTYLVTVKSREGIEPQKEFNRYNQVTFTLSNSAPVLKDGFAAENKSAYVLDLSQYAVTVPADLFMDLEEDSFSIQIDFIDGNGNTVKGPELEGGEKTDVYLPGFGSWTVKATATDTEGKSSEQVIICQITINNLKLILFVAGGGLLLAGGIVAFILIRKRNQEKARFQDRDSIVFIQDGKPVSKQIRLAAGESKPIALTTFAFAVEILLTDTQWSNMKEWMIVPTHDEKPVFQRIGKNAGAIHEIDLGDGLIAAING